jgi:quercetin dioxygenase-like cupin family protein
LEARFIATDTVERFSLVGLDIAVRTSARDTGGALTVLEQVVPTGAGSPLHTVREDKVLTVVEGHVTVQLGSERQRLGPGATAVIPRGTPHRFHNPEAMPARFLMLIMPGGHEVFLSEMARLEALNSLTPAAMAQLAERYGVAILPDPST